MAHKGSCFCGAVKFEVSGDPVAMGYCHCKSCRTWSASPVNAFSLWKPGQIKVTGGEDFLRKFQKTKLTERRYCGKCGGHIMANHPPLGLIDIYAAMLPELDFVPGVHVNYEDTVMPMKDGLPKLKDFPKEFGGSGDVLPE